MLWWWRRQMQARWKRRALLATIGLALYPLAGLVGGLLKGVQEWVEDFRA